MQDLQIAEGIDKEAIRAAMPTKQLPKSLSLRDADLYKAQQKKENLLINDSAD